MFDVPADELIVNIDMTSGRTVPLRPNHHFTVTDIFDGENILGFYRHEPIEILIQ